MHLHYYISVVFFGYIYLDFTVCRKTCYIIPVQQGADGTVTFCAGGHFFLPPSHGLLLLKKHIMSLNHVKWGQLGGTW